MAYYKNEPIGFDALLVKDQDARLWLAAFVFRDNPELTQIFSDTHKRMDWELICQCKKKGIIRFDFGGINSFQEPNGISLFKLDFEKENKVDYKNYLVANSFLGKIAIKYLKERK